MFSLAIVSSMARSVTLVDINATYLPNVTAFFKGLAQLLGAIGIARLYHELGQVVAVASGASDSQWARAGWRVTSIHKCRL